MPPEFIYFLCCIAVFIDVLCTETIKDNDGARFTCDNETDCEATRVSNEFGTTTIASETETMQTAYEVLNGGKYSPVNVTSISPLTSTTPLNSAARPTAKAKSVERSRNERGICSCDLTVYSCDVNCCCDIDCVDLKVEKIFNCEDNKQLKISGTRYCYDGNYIQQNKTRYLLDKLRDNLFCIAYDNLPPVYTTEYDPIITDRNTLDKILKQNIKSKFKLQQSAAYTPVQFPTDKPYRYGDVVWRMRNKFIKKLELPQTGFTGVCSFEKPLKYLENWSLSCMQILLENSNEQLFVENYNNFTVIASPSLYNDSNFTSANQSCPKNICLPLKSHYCFGTWNFCSRNESIASPPAGKCANGSCVNVVRNVRYVITHSGIKGIEAVEVYIKIGNATEKFYQKFKVEYKWLGDDESRIIHLSGNPGYILGKPIVLGNLLTNKTGGGNRSYIIVDENENFLSLPVAAMDGRCDDDRRYEVNFGEDLKLGCKIELQTRKFSVASCIDLQKSIVDALLKKILFNVTEVDRHSAYIAKWNRLDKGNGIEDWAKIFFDRIPTENVLTGQIIDDQIICSGLVTSLRIDIVHRRLPEPQPLDNYKILGVAVTFSENSDIYWSKCDADNCTDILDVDVVSYVMFHDVSQPSKYFFAEGPNFDITLPHDFFYPFINAAGSNRSHILVVIICCTLLAFNY